MLRKKKIAYSQKQKKRAVHKRKGQSTVEYIILVAAVIAVILVFVGSDNTGFRKAFTNALTQATNGMENMAGRLSASRPLAP